MMRKYTNEQLIDEIKRIAAKLGVSTYLKKDFDFHSKISSTVILNRFVSWENALKEAGLQPFDYKQHSMSSGKIGDTELLLDLIRLYKEFRKIPSNILVNAKGKYSERPYRDRWKSIKNAFEVAKQSFPENFNLEETPIQIESQTKVNTIAPSQIQYPKIEKKKQFFGEPIDFRGLRFAPLNEQGVVYLFGMISHELGYLIESIRTEYPDCEGKRCCDKTKNQWEHINIEFEFKSSSFKLHGHDANECDIIVCWIHDWNDCPIEVLELKSVIKNLSHQKP